MMKFPEISKFIKVLKLPKISRPTSKPIIIGGLISLIIVSVFIGVIFVRQSYSMPSESLVPITPTASSIIRHPLTGSILSAPLETLPQVFGIMIENSADAWPLSGLDQAFEVIEAPVEGSIPRFIAFFSTDEVVKKIGPVRSSRAYYLDWNAEFNGIYGHVGGSPAAINLIKQNGTLDLNQYFQSEYYYRDEVSRYAPHNVYTTSESLKKSIEEIGKLYSTAALKYDAWQWQDGVSQSSIASEINLKWSNSSYYHVNWKYDPTTNLYTRKQGGNTYTANNVAIIATDISTIANDDQGRQSLRTIGTGKMHLFQNGLEIIGTWSKPSRTDRLRFINTDGKEVLMNAGKTWVAVTDSLSKLSVK